MFTREIQFETLDKCLYLSQESEGDVGCVVWDAAIVLAKYLETLCSNDARKTEVTGQHVVELGAGTGCVGLVAALLGASHVTITDLPQILPLMEMNIAQNQDNLQCKVEARELTWGNAEQCASISTPHLILVADCIYYEESMEPLVSTLRTLCGRSSTIFLSYEQRTSGNKPELQRKFFKLMDQHFRKTKVPLEEQHQLYRSPDIHIYKFCVR